VFLNITEADIASVFKTLCLGEVDRIDLAPRVTASGHVTANMAFVYFKTWSTSVAAQNLASRIVDTKRDARIVYDDPWYWILLPNSNHQPVKPVNRTALTDMIDELEARICRLENEISEYRRVQNEISDRTDYVILNYPPRDVGAMSSDALASRWQSAVSDCSAVPDDDDLTPPPMPPKLVRQVAGYYPYPTTAEIQESQSQNLVNYDADGNRFVWCPSLGKFFKDNASAWCDP